MIKSLDGAWAYCIEDVSNIENYDKAVDPNNNDIWFCHHRMETHRRNGKLRVTQLSPQDLKERGLYYHRPASELIFVTKAEHNSIHCKGKRPSEEARRRMSEAHKGKAKSEEHKRKLSEALKGHNVSEEARRHMSEAQKGKRRAPFSEEAKRKMSEAKKAYWDRRKRGEQE